MIGCEVLEWSRGFPVRIQYFIRGAVGADVGFEVRPVAFDLFLVEIPNYKIKAFDQYEFRKEIMAYF